MPLVKSDQEPGLWLNAQAQADALHALVIGISDYPFLNYSSESGQMGSLAVSARTAAQIFTWLRKRGSVAGIPVASCRLLLAPVAGERAEVDALTGGWYADGSFTALRNAVDAWARALSGSARAGGRSGAFFFFSGHGMEHLAEPSLLAADILDPGAPHRGGQALALNNLLQAVRTYGIERGLFFIDACRNAPDIAKRLNIVGQPLLQPNPDAVRGPSALVWLQAARMGDYAYQAPTAPATIFGRALLEGLEGLPPDFQPYEAGGSALQLLFGRLERYVKKRVRELIAQHSSTQEQVVEPGGNPYDYDLVVAERGPGVGVSRGSHRVFFVDSVDLEREAPSQISELELGTAADLPQRRYAEKGIATAGGDLADFSVMHAVLGSEAVTVPWIQRVRVLDLGSGDPAGNSVQVYGGQHQDVDGRRTAWVDLRVEPGAGRVVWIEVEAFDGERGFAVAIPRDRYVATPVRLDLRFGPEEGSAAPRLKRISARIGSINHGRLEPEERHLWEPLREVQQQELLSDLGSAARLAGQLHILEGTLQDKATSPVAAALAAALLLRAGALAELHDWPRNLADWFPWLADGPVLWAETLLARGAAAESGTRQEALRYFLMTAQRGAPLLTPVLQLAVRQAGFWRELQARGSDWDEATKAQLHLACASVEAAAAAAIPDGTFAAFIDLDLAQLRRTLAGGRLRRQPRA